MNQRILELAKKAGITFKPMIVDGVEYEYRHVQLNDYTNGIDEATCIAQFAELIVQECADMATKEYNNRSSIHGNDLLKHFGVKNEQI